VSSDHISDQPIGTWLSALASAAPAPGGGAAAALEVAVGAALIEMVCNLTIGKPRYAEHEATMIEALERAGDLRREALDLAEADAVAFAKVSDAYKLPKDDDAARQRRSDAIQAALVDAADVPLRTARAAADVIALADRIAEGANVNVLSDVTVAASTARAGLEAAAVNVEINLASMEDPERRTWLADELAAHLRAIAAAERVAGRVRDRIVG
jgi:methenyltetrahydrofolate cyclohydrolase